MAGHVAVASGAAVPIQVPERAQDARLEESPDNITRQGRVRAIASLWIAVGAQQAAVCIGRLG
jgi:hypothetical protein